MAPELAQLRVYNGFNCDFTLNISYNVNETESYIVGPLGVYEKLDIETRNLTELPYSLSGQENSACAKKLYNGNFLLKEKTANSFFIANETVQGFIDNNDKAIDGIKVR